MWESIVAAIVKGIVEPLVAWLTAYRQGRLAERAKHLEDSLAEQQKVDDAVADVRHRHQPLPLDFLRGGGPGPPASQPSPTPAKPSNGGVAGPVDKGL